MGTSCVREEEGGRVCEEEFNLRASPNIPLFSTLGVLFFGDTDTDAVRGGVGKRKRA